MRWGHRGPFTAGKGRGGQEEGEARRQVERGRSWADEGESGLTKFPCLGERAAVSGAGLRDLKPIGTQN